MTATRKVRVNLANEQELLELPGLGAAGAAAIVRFRSEHGPITDARQLSAILRGHPNVDAVKESADFAQERHELGRVGEARHEEEGGPRGGLLLDRPVDLDPVDLGHPEVGHDQIVGMRGETIEGRAPAIGPVDLSVGGRQQHLDQLAHVGLVVHDENAGHGKRMLP